MRPPRFDLPHCCPDSGTHLRRFLPVPETPEEEALIAAYDDASGWNDDRDTAEAVRRFMADGPTPENFRWAAETERRLIDLMHDDRECQ